MKLVVPEVGSTDAAAVWGAADRTVSSRALYPEARSALGRAIRSRRVRRTNVLTARALIESLWNDLDRVELTGGVARRAGDLAEHYGLRAYDAVHLASFEHLGDPEAMLVSADEELIGAAQALGFTTIRPQA